MQKIQKDRADTLEGMFGDQPCEHKKGYYQEYNLKGDTKARRCVTCYRSFPRDEGHKKPANSHA